MNNRKDDTSLMDDLIRFTALLVLISIVVYSVVAGVIFGLDKIFFQSDQERNEKERNMQARVSALIVSGARCLNGVVYYEYAGFRERSMAPAFKPDGTLHTCISEQDNNEDR